MKGYKAFKKGMICRGKQYAENTVFEEGEAKICNKGMHFCKDPLEVLKYYPLVDENGEMSEFAEVEAVDFVTDDNKKYCTKKLKVGAKISFAQLIQASVIVEGEGVIGSSEDGAHISSSGDGARIGSSGSCASISSSGYDASIGSSGDGAHIGSSGYNASISSSGYDVHISSSGDGAYIGSSGDDAHIGSSGYDASISSSGSYASISSSGSYARISSSGSYARITSHGKNSVIMCAGDGGTVKAKKGSWITLSEWKNVNGTYTPVCVKTEFVDGERIKEDTYYKLKKGLFVKVE